MMAKRFIDTGFLQQKWIRKLKPEQKIFLIYLMLECDNGGVIDLDMEDAEFWIGKKIGNPIEFLPEGYLIPINDSTKYFQPKFIEWQYPNFPKSRVHQQKQGKEILAKNGLFNIDTQTLNLPKDYIKFTQTLPKPQVNGNGSVDDNVSVKKKKAEKYKFGDSVLLTKDEHIKLLSKHGKFWTAKIIETLDNYKGSSGKNYKSDYKAILSWVEEKVKLSPGYAKFQTGKRRDEAISQSRSHNNAIDTLKGKIPIDEINKLKDETEE